MRGVNKVILVGRVGSEPEVRYTPQGKAVANFSLATSEKWKDATGNLQEKTEWHRISIWGKLAEIVDKYVKKGDALYLEGKNETRKWQDKEGNDRYTTGVVCHEMQMLGGKRDAQQSNDQGKPDGYQKKPPAPGAPSQNQPEPDFDFDDDIPF